MAPNAKFNPLGPEPVKLTGAENVPIDCTVIVVVPDAPGPSESEAGLTVIVKSAAPEFI